MVPTPVFSAFSKDLLWILCTLSASALPRISPDLYAYSSYAYPLSALSLTQYVDLDGSEVCVSDFATIQAVIPVSPPIRQRSAHIVPPCCRSHSVLQRIFNYCLTATGYLCYSIHSGFVLPPVAFLSAT